MDPFSCGYCGLYLLIAIVSLAEIDMENMIYYLQYVIYRVRQGSLLTVYSIHKDGDLSYWLFVYK